MESKQDRCHNGMGVGRCRLRQALATSCLEKLIICKKMKQISDRKNKNKLRPCRGVLSQVLGSVVYQTKRVTLVSPTYRKEPLYLNCYTFLLPCFIVLHGIHHHVRPGISYLFSSLSVFHTWNVNSIKIFVLLEHILAHGKPSINVC